MSTLKLFSPQCLYIICVHECIFEYTYCFHQTMIFFENRCYVIAPFAVIPYKGKVKRILHDIRDGIRSSCSYVGASNLEEYRSLVELVEVTGAGQVEAQPHLLN